MILFYPCDTMPCLHCLLQVQGAFFEGSQSNNLGCKTFVIYCSSFLIHRYIPGSCKAKVADFEVTASVQQEIAWLQITVEHIGRVDVLEPPQNLRTELSATKAMQCTSFF